jgi:hypothetical protein
LRAKSVAALPLFFAPEIRETRKSVCETQLILYRNQILTRQQTACGVRIRTYCLGLLTNFWQSTSADSKIAIKLLCNAKQFAYQAVGKPSDLRDQQVARVVVVWGVRSMKWQSPMQV